VVHRHLLCNNGLRRQGTGTRCEKFQEHPILAWLRYAVFRYEIRRSLLPHPHVLFLALRMGAPSRVEYT